MSRLAKSLLDRVIEAKLPKCESCLPRKGIKKPFGKASRALSPLELIYSDIYGPMSVRAHYRAIYFITLVDDYS